MSRSPITIFDMDADGMLLNEHFYKLLPQIKEILAKKAKATVVTSAGEVVGSEGARVEDAKSEELALQNACDAALKEIKDLGEGELIVARGTVVNKDEMAAKVALLLANEAFFQQVDKEAASSAKRYLVCGSSRQSSRVENGKVKQYIDEARTQHYAEFFPLLPLAAKKLKAEFIPFLTADLYENLPIGTSYKLHMAARTDLSQFDLQHAEEYPDDPKLTLIYAHLHGLLACLQITDGQAVHFKFFDDIVPGILDVAHPFFQQTAAATVRAGDTLTFYHKSNEKGAEAKLYKTPIAGVKAALDTRCRATLLAMAKTLLLVSGDKEQNPDELTLRDESREELVGWFNTAGHKKLPARDSKAADNFDKQLAQLHNAIATVQEKLGSKSSSFEELRIAFAGFDQATRFAASDFSNNFAARVAKLKPYNEVITDIRAQYAAKILQHQLDAKEDGQQVLSILAERVKRQVSLSETKLEAKQQAALLAIDTLRRQVVESKGSIDIQSLEMKPVLKSFEICSYIKTMPPKIFTEMKPRLERYVRFY